VGSRPISAPRDLIVAMGQAWVALLPSRAGWGTLVTREEMAAIS
jgi:hypothetical protein